MVSLDTILSYNVSEICASGAFTVHLSRLKTSPWCFMTSQASLMLSFLHSPDHQVINDGKHTGYSLKEIVFVAVEHVPCTPDAKGKPQKLVHVPCTHDAKGKPQKLVHPE